MLRKLWCELLSRNQAGVTMHQKSGSCRKAFSASTDCVMVIRRTSTCWPWSTTCVPNGATNSMKNHALEVFSMIRAHTAGAQQALSYPALDQVPGQRGATRHVPDESAANDGIHQIRRQTT